jgi:hypothetical protein
MPPDIECRELTATGLAEPKADWTAAARRNVEQALGDLFAARRAELRTYDASELSPGQRQRVDQIMKLHDAVVRSIVTADALPTKRDRFEWSLGPGVRSLKEEFGTDYALFVIVRDSYASGGRKVMMAFSLLSALAGTFVPVEGGMLLGAASLVDLETGDVVWFNQVASETGDLRAEEPAADAVQDLMTGCPL